MYNKLTDKTNNVRVLYSGGLPNFKMGGGVSNCTVQNQNNLITLKRQTIATTNRVILL